MAKILYTQGPLTVAGGFGANTPGFKIILELTTQEQQGMTLLCPPDRQVDLAVAFTTVNFEARQVQYAGNQIAITYMGGPTSNPDDVAEACKQTVEEKLAQALG